MLPKFHIPKQLGYSNHWSNEQTMLKYIKEIIAPFANSTRRRLKLAEQQPAHAIFDHFRDQLIATKELKDNFQILFI